jgi:hypothetical protein
MLGVVAMSNERAVHHKRKSSRLPVESESHDVVDSQLPQVNNWKMWWSDDDGQRQRDKRPRNNSLGLKLLEMRMGEKPISNNNDNLLLKEQLDSLVHQYSRLPDQDVVARDFEAARQWLKDSTLTKAGGVLPSHARQALNDLAYIAKEVGLKNTFPDYRLPAVTRLELMRSPRPSQSYEGRASGSSSSSPMLPHIILSRDEIGRRVLQQF